MANNEPAVGRGRWSTNFGFILAAVGSAIGLGNIWRFSFLCHKHGGGAFLIPYFTALVLVGVPLMLLEYGFGHRERGASALSFRRVGKSWEWGGWWMPTAAMFGINVWYMVVIGWCVSYFLYSFTLGWGSDPEAFFNQTYLQVSAVGATFAQASTEPLRLGAIVWPILAATLAVWFICWLVCYRDVAHGIERACKVFMPLLFVLTLILVGWSVNLPGAKEAILDHYLHFDFPRINPQLSVDWSKLNPFDWSQFDLRGAIAVGQPAALSAWRDAFGQIFFTLSLGFGIMIAYASYLPRKSDMVTNAVATCVINCGYSFVAGFIVFGVVGFMAKQKGVDFVDAISTGPPLAFIVYPKAISLLPALKQLFGAMFFLVLILAGVSSGISLIEAFVCSITDKFGGDRRIVVTAICVVGFLGSIVFCTQAGLPILDIVNHFVDYALVLGGLMECIIVGWVIRSYVLRKHLAEASGHRIPFLWDLSIRFVAPAFLAFILASGIYNEFVENYEGYRTAALLLFGLSWMVVLAIAALALTVRRWKPERLRREHVEAEDELLV